MKIESCLNDGMSYAAIGRSIGKSDTTISREVTRNCIDVPARKNICMLHGHCERKHICEKPCNERCSRKCHDHCFDICDMYQPYVCEKMTMPPYVCNGCGHTAGCKLNKRFYRAKAADDNARLRKVESRSGFDLTEEELMQIDEIASPLLRKGQAPFHILQSHPELPIGLQTLYRLIDKGLLSASNTDLKQKVRRKPRKGGRRGKLHNESGVSVRKAGRMYEDFLTYIEETDSAHVEMDCVEGKQGEKPALLTLHFKELQMQLAYYLEKHDSAHVVETLDNIERAIGTDLFREAFPVILTDNGPEFSDFDAMESSYLFPGQKRTKIFFCEPNRSDEKGSCENNHKLIRDVIPKGTSLLPLIQSDITLMMNHINSYRRKKARGLSAYDLAMQVLPEAFFTALDLKKIPDDDIVLAPALLKSELKKRKVKYNYSII